MPFLQHNHPSRLNTHSSIVKFSQRPEKSTYQIPDNLYEAIGPYADIEKIITFKIEMYNSI